MSRYNFSRAELPGEAARSEAKRESKGEARGLPNKSGAPGGLFAKGGEPGGRFDRAALAAVPVYVSGRRPGERDERVGRGERGGGWGGGVGEDAAVAPARRNMARAGARDERLERELFGGEHKQVAGAELGRYDEAPVETSGEAVPEPVESFAAAKLHAAVQANVVLAGYARPTPVQRHAMAVTMAGRDLVACAQTGSGKTAAFLAPMLHQLLVGDLPDPPGLAKGRGRRGATAHPYALVLGPTRELVLQIHAEARKFTYRTGVRAVVVHGGAEAGPQYRELERGADVIVATPGRLQDLVERGRVALGLVRFLVLDEADRMLDMGFEPQIRRLVEGGAMSRERQTSMFSATFPAKIQRLAADFLRDHVFLAVGRVGSAAQLVAQRVCYARGRDDKRAALLAVLAECGSGDDERPNGLPGLVLVFVETKRSADALEHWLEGEGVAAACIHGDREQRERERALADFRAGRRTVLVATSVAARGLDVPNVCHVVNFDMPREIDDYVHRIGRTGRAGNTGAATAFVSEADGPVLRELHELLREAKQPTEPWFDALAAPGRGNRKGAGRGGGGRFGGRDFRKTGGGGGGGRSSG